MRSAPKQATGPVQITLTSEDEAWGSRVGAARNANGERKNYTPRLGAGTDVAHDLGARAELAVARLYDLEWHDPERLDYAHMRDPDVGCVDVRASNNPQARLPLHKNDPRSRPVTLVIVGPNDYTVVGWIYGYQGKLDEFWHEADAKGPGYWPVPQGMLFDPAWMPRRGAGCEEAWLPKKEER